MKLRWTRLALQDLRHLHEYIAEDNPSAANRMVTRIQDATQRLRKHPQMGRPGRVQGTRELTVVGAVIDLGKFVLSQNSILLPFPLLNPDLNIQSWQKVIKNL